MGIEVKTFEDAVKVEDMFFKGLYIIENESTGRRVSIILDENCIRWQGFANGAEAHMMGVSDKKFRMHGYGWVPVRGRHEFRNGDGDKCVRNALRFVNDTARNYFNDYDETRSERMTWVEPEKVSKAIDKLARRYRNSQECDCMFVKNDDDTGWRLMYGYDERRFDPKTSKRTLRLRHYTVYSADSWDTEETVSVARAKECILGGRVAMSTRSATIIRQTTYWGEQADTEELMRFYRHCDGYPEGHGMELAQAVTCADRAKLGPCYWLATVLEWFMLQSPYSTCIEFEPKGCQHGDLEYLYVVDGIVDHRCGETKDGRLPITISVYGIGWDEDYDVAMERTPIFSGTAYEYIQKFGKEQ